MPPTVEAMSRCWVMVGPAVGTWIDREQGRVALSLGGRQASLAPVQRIPFCQTAVSRRSSLVAIEPGMPGWSAFGGCEVAGMAGSDSFQATFPCSGVPVIATTPRVGEPVLAPRVGESLLL